MFGIRRNMTENTPRPTWRRLLRLAFRVYAGLCTLVITVYILLIVGICCFTQGPATRPEEMRFMMSYGTYMAKEYPERADFFGSLGGMLEIYATSVSVSKADLLKYLGKPDLAFNADDQEYFVYFYNPSDTANKLAIHVAMKKGNVTQVGSQVGFNEATVNDYSSYKPYSETGNFQQSAPADRE